jgi:hypothetical protein
MYSFGKGIAGLSVPKTEAERQRPESEVASRLKNATKNFRYQLVHGEVDYITDRRQEEKP